MFVKFRSGGRHFYKLAGTVLTILFFQLPAVGCPRLFGFIDYNCDGKISIVGVGDSFVSGQGDLEHRSNPGYIGRLSLKFPEVKFTKVGFPGITAQKLLAEIKQEFEKRPRRRIAKALGTADILIVDVGRNNFYDFDSPAFTVAVLKRLSLYLKAKTTQVVKSSPLIVVSFIAPSPRRFQQPWIDETNALLLEFRSEDFPVYLRSDLLDVTTISVDGIHPAAAGHQQLSDLVAEYLEEEAPKRQRLFRTDLDKDGIYDQFEKLRFKTSSRKADTDGDSLSDGDEVFTFKTSPIKQDTDEDGFADPHEITSGSDPLTPNPSPPEITP
jgi:lysophospholipase L1-like esterase